jgi:hypothetical protein
MSEGTGAAISTNLQGSNIVGKVISGILPLVIVIYFMYQTNHTWSSLFIGMSIIFLIGLVAFLCGCQQEPRTKTLVTLLSLLLYSIIATTTSINIKKLSKYKYFWVNTIVQYSIFLNLFVFMSIANKSAS